MISENNGKSPAQTEAANTAVRAKPQVDAGRLSIEAGMLRWIILAAAVLFIFFGIFRDETAAVFRKAATICLECIGIG